MRCYSVGGGEVAEGAEHFLEVVGGWGGEEKRWWWGKGRGRRGECVERGSGDV